MRVFHPQGHRFVIITPLRNAWIRAPTRGGDLEDREFFGVWQGKIGRLEGHPGARANSYRACVVVESQIKVC